MAHTATQAPSQASSLRTKQAPLPRSHSGRPISRRRWAATVCGSSAAVGSAGQMASRQRSASRAAGHVHCTRQSPSGSWTAARFSPSAAACKPSFSGGSTAVRIHSASKAWWGAKRSGLRRTSRTSNTS